MNEGKTPKIGVGVLCMDNHQLLMLKRRFVHGAGTWSTPGGHLEFGETPEACALRELTEETTIIGESPSFIGITNDFFEAEGKHYITLWFKVDWWKGAATLGAPEESSEVGWFPANELPQPLFLPLQNLLTGKPDLITQLSNSSHREETGIGE